MRIEIFTGLIIVLGILVGCTAPQETAVMGQPMAKELAPGEMDSKLTLLTNEIINSLTRKKRSRIAVIEFSDLNGNDLTPFFGPVLN